MNILNFCLNIKKIINVKLYKFIDFGKCPYPEENYGSRYLIQFVESIIENKEIYFPSDKFIVLIDKLRLKDYHKLIELKSIFTEYETFWKAKEIKKKLDEAIHFTGKKFIEEDKLDNLEIIIFIQKDAETYFKEYETNQNFTSLISHINLDTIDKKKFCEKFIWY